MLGSSWPSDILATHLFAHRFGKNTPDLSGTKAAIAGLADAFLEGLQRNVPPQWLTASATSKLSTTVVKLKERRDTVDEWFRLLQAWVERP